MQAKQYLEEVGNNLQNVSATLAQCALEDDRNKIMYEVIDNHWRSLSLSDLLALKGAFDDPNHFTQFDARVWGLLAAPILEVSLDDNDVEGAIEWCCRGARFNAVQLQQMTPKPSALARLLRETARRGHVQEVTLLLQAGAHPTDRDTEGWATLHWASFGGHTKVMELLLTYGAQPGTPAKDGLTPLHSAARHGHRDAMELLLNHNADPEATGTDG